MFKYLILVVAIFLSLINFLYKNEGVLNETISLKSETETQEKVVTKIDNTQIEEQEEFIQVEEKSFSEITELEITFDLQDNLNSIEQIISSLSDSITDLQNQKNDGVQNINYNELNSKLRDATVNILCFNNSSGYFSPASASGVIIDPRGVVLTNAHATQYFLLKNYRYDDAISCEIRTGSPARSAYKADLLYISPKWVQDNKDNLKEEISFGTGEDDFALLLIKSTLNQDKDILEQFPYIELSNEKIKIEDSVVITGYPAEFLGGISIQKDLFLVSTISSIKSLFSFYDTSTDLFSIGDVISAQAGSSGSPVINTKGELIGIITTSTVENTTKNRDLRAITIDHINNSLETYEDLNIEELLSYNLQETSKNFNENIAPSLLEILTKDL